MKNSSIGYENLTAQEVRLLESIVGADTLVDAYLAGLLDLVERKGDAVLSLSHLRQLRQACERMRQLLAQTEGPLQARARAKVVPRNYGRPMEQP